ncbi:MAG TPA: Sir2 family NAD-dependent protein deacetylase [Candidatus Saccharimonadales bacterium]|nr:Sir2 family NAD-dependent protein deacetylase [Candidatus Saccharimonadales bacterium]
MEKRALDIQAAGAWLRTAKAVLVFTGAGISAESGIPTFRGDEGVWDNFPTRGFSTWPGLLLSIISRPQSVADFLARFIEPIANAEPNCAHRAIFLLQQQSNAVIVTQNVDGLQQLAGSLNVTELHGSLFITRSFSISSRKQISRTEMRELVKGLKRVSEDKLGVRGFVRAICPLWGLNGLMPHWPDVILFGQRLPRQAWNSAFSAAKHCDCMLVVGTSGVVFPASLLPKIARSNGAKIIGIGPEKPNCDLWLAGNAVEILPTLVSTAFGLAEGH